jgi:hypothetical protein
MPVLVVITPRKYGKVIGAHIEELEKSVIPVAVLDIDGLKKAYGPSICSTQLFQSAEELNRRFALRD